MYKTVRSNGPQASNLSSQEIISVVLLFSTFLKACPTDVGPDIVMTVSLTLQAVLFSVPDS